MIQRKSFLLDNEVASLQAKLGYTFLDLRILNQAFRINEDLSDANRVFDVIEKAGDAVLCLATVGLLMHKYHGANAGEISRMESLITCNDNLAHLATRLELHDIIWRVSKRVLTRKVLADTMEAILGAIALDAGRGDPTQGMPSVVPVCRHLFGVELETCRIASPEVKLSLILKKMKVRKRDISYNIFSHRYRNSFIGMVCKYEFRSKRLQRLFRCSGFGGTGYSFDSALSKTAAIMVLQLERENIPSTIPSLDQFSWKIKPPMQ